MGKTSLNRFLDPIKNRGQIQVLPFHNCIHSDCQHGKESTQALIPRQSPQQWLDSSQVVSQVIELGEIQVQKAMFLEEAVTPGQINQQEQISALLQLGRQGCTGILGSLRCVCIDYDEHGVIVLWECCLESTVVTAEGEGLREHLSSIGVNAEVVGSVEKQDHCYDGGE